MGKVKIKNYKIYLLSFLWKQIRQDTDEWISIKFEIYFITNTGKLHKTPKTAAKMDMHL